MAAHAATVSTRGTNEPGRCVRLRALVNPAQHGSLAQALRKISQRRKGEFATAAGLNPLLGRLPLVGHVPGLGERRQLAAPQRVEGLPAHDAAQPGRECLGIEQAGEAAPCDDEGVLDHVASDLGVVHERYGRAVREALVALHQRREGLDVASACLLHQRRQVHRASRCLSPLSAARLLPALRFLAAVGNGLSRVAQRRRAARPSPWAQRDQPARAGGVARAP